MFLVKSNRRSQSVFRHLILVWVRVLLVLSWHYQEAVLLRCIISKSHDSRLPPGVFHLHLRSPPHIFHVSWFLSVFMCVRRFCVCVFALSNFLTQSCLQTRRTAFALSARPRHRRRLVTPRHRLSCATIMPRSLMSPFGTRPHKRGRQAVHSFIALEGREWAVRGAGFAFFFPTNSPLKIHRKTWSGEVR